MQSFRNFLRNTLKEIYIFYFFKIFIYFFILLNLINLVNGLSLEITEIFPNPSGKDKGEEKEFIEIHNYGNLSIGLKGVRLKNSNNKTIELSDFHDEIWAYEYLVFYPSFNLKNTDEKIWLFYGFEILDEYNYNDSIEGMSWIKIEDEWHIGKKSEGKPNFKNITIIEYKLSCLNQSIIKTETLLKNNQNHSKYIYISRNLKQKRLGFYFLLLALVFAAITFLIEKWKEKR